MHGIVVLYPLRNEQIDDSITDVMLFLFDVLEFYRLISNEHTLLRKIQCQKTR